MSPLQKLRVGGASGNAAPHRNGQRGAPGRLPDEPSWQVESRPDDDSALPVLSRKLGFGLKGPLALTSGQAAGAGAKRRFAASSGTTRTRDMAAAKPRTQPGPGSVGETPKLLGRQAMALPPVIDATQIIEDDQRLSCSVEKLFFSSTFFGVSLLLPIGHNESSRLAV